MKSSISPVNSNQSHVSIQIMTAPPIEIGSSDSRWRDAKRQLRLGVWTNGVTGMIHSN
jgi:hypothetical protein